ncbi:MAG TPA: diacylglycerol kinase family protein [Trueperaceae bacterium]|nr:diacylglycerol kinase family protein [Trueperaceae bacterium]
MAWADGGGAPAVSSERVLLIINPVAGHGDGGGIRRHLEEGLDRAGVDYRVRETAKAGDAFAWARATDAERVIVAGGDGTVAEAVSGLIAAGRRVPVAQVPGGTGNLLARALGLQRDLDAALATALGGVALPLDVGYLPDRQRHFTLVAGVGWDAQLVDGAPRSLKRRVGMLAYVLAGVSALFRLRSRRVRVEIDGEPHDFRAHTVMVFNVGELAGPGLKLDPDVDPHDGRLDVVVVSTLSALGLLRLLLELLRGRLRRFPGFRRFSAREVRISAVPPLPAELDGEPIGVTPLHIEVVPDGALFMVSPEYAEARQLAGAPLRGRGSA